MPEALVEELFQTLSKGSGITLYKFLKCLYTFQNENFCLNDAINCFNISNGSGTSTLDVIEFQSALTKVALLRRQDEPDKRLTRRFVSEILSTEELESQTKSRILQEKTLAVVKKYSNSLLSSYDMYSTLKIMSSSQLLDYFTAYFLCPEYFSKVDITKLLNDVKSEFSLVNLRHDELIFPQFLHLLAKASVIMHDVKVSRIGKNIRNSIDSTKMDVCLSTMLKEHMCLQVVNSSVAVPTTVVTRQDTSDINDLFTKLYNRLSSSDLEPVVVDTKVVLIRQVAEIPTLPPKAIYEIQCGIKYHNSDEYNLALAAYSRAREEASPLNDKVQVYFALVTGAVNESRRQDYEALELYIDALTYETSCYTPLLHSAIACSAYYHGHVALALSYYELAKEDNKELSTILNNIGCCKIALGEKEDGYLYFKQAYGIMVTDLGSGHARTSLCLKNLESSKARFGKITKEGLQSIRKSRLDDRFIIPGGRFQINALVPAKTKQKKKGVKKKKKN